MAANGELTFDPGALAGLSATQEDRVVAGQHGGFSSLIYLAQLRGLEGKHYVPGFPRLKREPLKSA